MILANANDLALIINYDRNHSFIILATVITIINYDRKTLTVQATAGPMKGQGVEHKCSNSFARLPDESRECLLIMINPNHYKI
jgi:hypothetical protein